MKLPKLKTLCLLCLGTISLQLHSQSVADLISGYTGTVEWDATKKTITFVTGGQITFATKGNKSWLWEVPTEVAKIYIKKNTRVNGAFHSKASLTIEGEDRKTSVVYGTETQSWPQKNGLTAYKICSFQNFGGTMTIKNLTSLNPRAFHVRGWGTKMMVSYCDFIDTRGGHGNHSDGVEGGDGSVFDNCYFETGDDIIKVYFNILVTNCTINMVENTVPIQLGWGNYSNGKTGTFRNLKIYGNSGRGAQGMPIINGRTGTYNVNVIIDSCDIQNPNASWVTLTEAKTGLNLKVTNANIKVKTHVGKYLNGPYTTSICGSTAQNATYNCLTTTDIAENANRAEGRVFPNPAKNFITIKTSGNNFAICDISGKTILSNKCNLNEDHIISLTGLKHGVYFVKTNEGISKFIKL
jgi:hypothetical protein